MAVNDVYEVIDVQTMYDQEVLNVYFYEQRAAFVPVSGTVAQNLAEEWNESVLPSVLPMQGAHLTHVETRVRNLFDAADTGIAISGVIGTSNNPAGDTLPSFNAYGFELQVDNSAVRKGAKRIGGVLEVDNAAGVPAASVIADLNAYADAIAAPITGGLIIMDDIMFPVVVKRIRSGAPGAYEYRLPESQGETVVGTILEVLVKLLITSQISRKIGIGI